MLPRTLDAERLASNADQVLDFRIR